MQIDRLVQVEVPRADLLIKVLVGCYMYIGVSLGTGAAFLTPLLWMYYL